MLRTLIVVCYHCDTFVFIFVILCDSMNYLLPQRYSKVITKISRRAFLTTYMEIGWINNQLLRISIISRIASVSIASFTGDKLNRGLTLLRSSPVTRSFPMIITYIKADFSVLDFTLKVCRLFRAGKICTNL